MSSFVVDVSDLLKTLASQKGVRVRENTGPLVLGEQRFFPLKPVELELVLEGVPAGVLARGSTRAELETVCSRCLTKISMEVEVEFEELFAAGRKQAEQLVGEEEAEEAYPISQEKVDLEPAARQALMLALPMQPLCSEVCKGLCPKCGQNLNVKKCGCRMEHVDARMEKLKDLLDEKEN